MATYSIQAPDGHTYSIEGPEGASQEDVQAEVLRQFPEAAGVPQEGPTGPDAMGGEVQPGTQFDQAFSDMEDPTDPGLETTVSYEGPNPDNPHNDALGAAVFGAADTITLGTLPKLGALLDATSAALAGGDWDEAYNSALKRNNGIIQYDEENHGTARLIGQLIGGLVIPAGLEGVGLKAGTQALRSGATMAEARIIAAKAVGKRMALTGGAFGAGHGAGSADNIPDAVTGAVTEGAIGAATGGLLGKAGEALAPRAAAKAAVARAAPMTDGARVQSAADRIGVDVLPADVGGPATRRMTGAAAQAPLSASPIITAAQRVVEQGKGVRDRVATSFGTAADTETAGQAAAKGARDYIKSTASRIGRLYDRARDMSGDLRVELPNAKSVLDEQIARLKEVPGGGEGLSEAEALRKSLDGTFTVQGIRDMRTELFIKPDFRGTPVERRLRQVVDAASLDIEQGLVRAGKEDAARAFAAADKQWRERLTTIERVIEPIIGKADRPKSGEEVIAALERASKGNASRMSRFLDSLPTDEAGMVRASLINRIGKASDGMQNAEGDAFSLGKFLTDWNKMSEGAKRTILDNEGRSALNDLARVAEGTKEAQRYANFSNTSGGIWGNLGLLAGGASLAPTTAAVAGGTQLVGGKLLSSPRFARWLARAPKAPDQKGYLGKLTSIARAEPAIANEVFALQQRLADAFTGGASRPLAAENEQNVGADVKQDRKADQPAQ